MTPRAEPNQLADTVAPRRGRRPGESGAKTLITEAARRQFGEHGYAHTTVRSIATEAGVDPSLVIHYFGTKQRLFGEVVDLGFEPEDIIAAVANGPASERGARLARFLIDLLKTPRYAAAFTALLHAASGEPQAATLWRERIRLGVFLPLSREIGLDNTELRAALAATQTFGFVVIYHIIKMDALTLLTDDELVAHIAPTLQRYLSEPLPLHGRR